MVQVNIPAERTYMHIDTVFTQINKNHFVGYKPIVQDGLGSYVDVGPAPTAKPLNTPVSKIFYWLKSIPIWSLYGLAKAKPLSGARTMDGWLQPYFLLKPGVAVTYDRNPVTERAFKDFGYKVIGAEKLLRDMENGKITPDKVENTIITIPSNELSRARGTTLIV